MMSTASHSVKQLAARDGISALYIERQDVDAASDPPRQTELSKYAGVDDKRIDVDSDPAARANDN